MSLPSPSQNGSVVTTQDSYYSVIIKNVIVIALGLTINYINGTLIHTFRKHQILYTNPRYVLFVHLIINDMIHLTTGITLFVSSYFFRKINGIVCSIILTFSLCTTINTPLNLAVMAFQCYIVIRFPLRHTEFCTMKRTYIIIALIWALNSISILPDIMLVAAEFRELFVSDIYCERNNLLRHPVSKEKREVLYAIYLVGVWLVLFYTYFHIVFAARAARPNGDSKKARNTILLHAFQLLLCILTYVFHLIGRLIVNLFPEHYANALFVSYILIHMLPRFISPIVYGLRDQLFRRLLKKHLLCVFCFKT